MSLLPVPPAPRPPFEVHFPTRQRAPVVVASPHSGRDYSDDFLAVARLDAMALRRSEDCYVDELVAVAPELGLPLLTAHFPRAWCDANRAAWELDPAMFSDVLPAWVETSNPRIQAGLGTIARVVSTGEPIYRHKLCFADAENRIRACWQPYHDALSGLIEQTWRSFAGCLLLDFHSMPQAGSGRDDPDFILGDVYGTSCASGVTRYVEDYLMGLGYVVRRNDPYSGGYVTRHYGRPREAVHALQIEIARRLYMDEHQFQRLPGFRRLADDLGRLLKALADGQAALMIG